MLVVFHREGFFYPIELPPGHDTLENIKVQAEVHNPGTLKVTTLEGEVLWEPTKQ